MSIDHHFQITSYRLQTRTRILVSSFNRTSDFQSTATIQRRDGLSPFTLEFERRQSSLKSLASRLKVACAQVSHDTYIVSHLSKISYHGLAIVILILVKLTAA